MPAFNDHIEQANENLGFLDYINQNCGNSFVDWRVTISFYTAVHIINAHLAKIDLQYRTHVDVLKQINPKIQLNVAAVGEDIYLAYRKLMDLSRRSRYLVNEKSPGSTTAAKTYDKHVDKAARHLEVMLKFAKDKLDEDMLKASIKSDGLNASDFEYLTIVKYSHSAL